MFFSANLFCFSRYQKFAMIRENHQRNMKRLWKIQQTNTMVC